jgi:hypothetical protein
MLAKFRYLHYSHLIQLKTFSVIYTVQLIQQTTQYLKSPNGTDKKHNSIRLLFLICLLGPGDHNGAYKRKSKYTQLSRKEAGVMRIAFSSKEKLWQKFNSQTNIIQYDDLKNKSK